MLTCNVLLPSPTSKLAAHSAFVQNSIYPQDVHLGLWDGPGPKSGSPLPAPFLVAHKCPELGHSFLKVPKDQSFISHLGLGMRVSSLWEGTQPDSQCHSPPAQGPHKDRVLTGHVTCASRCSHFGAHHPSPSGSPDPPYGLQSSGNAAAAVVPWTGQKISSHMETTPSTTEET